VSGSSKFPLPFSRFPTRTLHAYSLLISLHFSFPLISSPLISKCYHHVSLCSCNLVTAPFVILQCLISSAIYLKVLQDCIQGFFSGDVGFPSLMIQKTVQKISRYQKFFAELSFCIFKVNLPYTSCIK
jgi:hypothetical protein